MVTPDRFPGIREDEGIALSDEAVDPANVGEIVLNNGEIKAKDGTGVFNIRSGTGLSAAAHKILRQLIHFIDDGPAEGFASGAFREVLPTGSSFPTSIIWWDTSSKLKKIVEKTITRTGGLATNIKPTPIVWKVYDTDGSTVLATVSDAVLYSGVFETDRTRTIS